MLKVSSGEISFVNTKHYPAKHKLRNAPMAFFTTKKVRLSGLENRFQRPFNRSQNNKKVFFRVLACKS